MMPQHTPTPDSGIGMTNSDSMSDVFGGSLRVTGTVKSFDGQPVHDATIELRDLEHGGSFLTANTNASGGFSFSDVPPGNYEVIATNGMEQTTEQVEVYPRSAGASVDLRLPGKASGLQTAGNRTSVSLAEYSVPAKARSTYEKAFKAFEHGKIDEAEKLNAEALNMYPRFAEARTLRGLMEADQGKKDEAIADFEQSIHDDPNVASAYLGLASIYNSEGRFKEAMPLLDQAQRLAPRAWQTFFERSRANIGTGDYAAGLKNLDRAAELQGDPRKAPPQFHLLRAYALIGTKQIPQATMELEAYLNTAPTGPMAEHAREVLDKLHGGTTSAAR